MQCQVRSRSVSHSDKRVALCTCRRRACSCTASTKPPISTICLTSLLLFFFFFFYKTRVEITFFSHARPCRAPLVLWKPPALSVASGKTVGLMIPIIVASRLPQQRRAIDCLPEPLVLLPLLIDLDVAGKRKKKLWEALRGWKLRAGKQRITHLFLERLNPLFLTSDCLLQLQKKPPAPMLKTGKKNKKKNIQGTYLSKASCSSCCFNRARWHFRIKRKTKNETGCSLLQGVTPRS